MCACVRVCVCVEAGMGEITVDMKICSAVVKLHKAWEYQLPVKFCPVIIVGGTESQKVLHPTCTREIFM